MTESMFCVSVFLLFTIFYRQKEKMSPKVFFVMTAERKYLIIGAVKIGKSPADMLKQEGLWFVTIHKIEGF